MATEARKSHYRIDEPEDTLHLFDRQDLSIMRPLLPMCQNRVEDGPDIRRALLKLLQLLQRTPEAPRVTDKAFDELTPAQVAHQILSVVLGPQIPPLALTVLMAEFTHYDAINASLNESRNTSGYL
jgi:hypothetical protein